MLALLLLIPLAGLMIAIVFPSKSVPFFKAWPNLQTRKPATLFWIIMTFLVAVFLPTPVNKKLEKIRTVNDYLHNIDSLSKIGDRRALLWIDSVHYKNPERVREGFFILAMNIRSQYPDSAMNYFYFLLNKEMYSPSEPYSKEMIKMYLMAGDTTRANELMRMGIGKNNIHVIRLRDSLRLADLNSTGLNFK